jgi:hypothetical protein
MIAAIGLFLFAQAAQAAWTPAKRLTWTSGESNNPAIAVDLSGSVHVVWDDPTPGNWEIYYRKSLDAGASWITSKMISGTKGTSQKPVIAVDPSGSLYVVWADETPGNGEIYYTKSTDGGAIWAKSQRLTWTPGHSFEPAMAVSPSGNLHVVWEDQSPGNYEIYHKKSTDGGATWATNQRLSWNSGLSYEPAIAVDPSGNPHVAWVDGTDGWEVYYKNSTDGGATWAASQKLSRTSGGSYAPAMAADSAGNIHVFWSDDTPGNYEIYYMKCLDGKPVWAKSRRLTSNSGESWWPAAAVDSGGNLYMAWHDDTPGNHEVYCMRSTDGGTSWSPAKRLTWTSGYSADPAVAVDSLADLHLVWSDDTPGNAEIFYRKGN